MAKNKFFIEQVKNIRRTIRDITPSVYAALALALHRKCGWGYKRINDLFNFSQEIWNECVQSDMDILEMCEKETGINVMNKVSEKDG